MVFLRYKETCEVLLEYPKIGGGNIKEFIRKAIRNLLHANIDVHSKRLISEFPGDGIKCIDKLQPHCAKMTFAKKSSNDSIFKQVTHKGGESAVNYIKIFQNAEALSVSIVIFYEEDQLMHTFMDYFHQVGRYSAQIASH